MRRITHFIIICSFLLSKSIYANNKGPSIKEALEITVNQQILSRKISKIYLTLCHDIKNPQLYQERAAAIEQFEEHLYQLSLFVPNERVKKYIQSVRVAWKPFKTIADWAIKIESVNTLLSQGEELLKASKMLHSAYQEYEYKIKYNNNWITINQYINHIQHQKVLIQGVLTYYMADVQAHEMLDYSLKLATFQKSFVRILVILENATTTSDVIQETLALIRVQWESILNVLKDRESININVLYDVLEKGDAIEENIQQVMDRYTILSNNLSLSYTINQGAEQRIIAQEMATTFIASKHSKIKYVSQQKILDKTIDFEKNIQAMLLTAPTLEIENTVKAVRTMWKNYKQLLTDFNATDALQSFKTLEQGYLVMEACDQVNIMIKRYAETIPAYQKILPKNNKNTLMSEDVISQIEQLNHLKVAAQRVMLYFMMKTFDWDVTLSIKRLASSKEEGEILMKELSRNIEEESRRILLMEAKLAWEKLSAFSEEGTLGDFLGVVAYHEELQQKINKLSNACIYELNQLFAQDLQMNY